MADDEEMPELATNEEWRRIMVAARKTHGLTQSQLAAKVGVTQPLLSRIENEQSSSTYILRICRALQIPPPQHFEDEADRAWSQSGHVLRTLEPEVFQQMLALARSTAEAAQKRREQREAAERQSDKK